MSDLEKKARIFSNTEGTQSCKSMREVEYDTGRYVGYLAGFKDCQTEYEEKVNELLSALEQIANAPQPFNAFDKGYEQGYNDATREACQEIAKNYQPNDR